MIDKPLRSNNSISVTRRLPLVALLCGGFLAGMAQWVEAEPLLMDNLIAQDVVQGLPPPPEQAAQLQAADRSQGQRQSQGQAQTADRHYMVVVNGDSSRLLSQVQRVASNATVQEYQGQRVIQVATFNDADHAERQVQILASRGIGAKILTVTNAELPATLPAASLSPSAQPSSQARSPQTLAASPDLPPPELLPTQPVPREVDFNGGQQSTLNQFPSPPPLPANSGVGRSPDGRSNGRSMENLPNSAARSSQPDVPRSGQPSNGFSGGRAYFVVIPGKQGELEAISNQVIRLGDGFGIAQLVQQTNEPRGPHVQVGPFGDRNAADRWNRYFRDFGMDARIYIRR